MQETHDADDDNDGSQEEEEEEGSPVGSPPPIQASKVRRTAAKGKPSKPVETKPPVPPRRPINTPARAPVAATNKKSVADVVTTPPPKNKGSPVDARGDPKQRSAPTSLDKGAQLAQPVSMLPDQADSPALHRVKGKKSPDAKDELIRKLYADPCIFENSAIAKLDSLSG